jgi:hypothetical protein
MSKQYLSNKGVWSDIIKFLDINDYLNLELSCKNLRIQLLTFYQMKSKIIKPELMENEKNLKKMFLSKYMNSFVMFKIKSEYDDGSTLKEQHIPNDEYKKSSSVRKNSGMFIANNTTSCSSSPQNSLFSSE